MMAIPAKPRCRARSRDGRCYELVGKIMIDGDEQFEWIAVHGDVNGDPFGLTRVGHAWLEHPNGYAFCPVLDEMLPRDEFRRRVGAIAVVRYTRKELACNVVRANHWGPWRDIDLTA